MRVFVNTNRSPDSHVHSAIRNDDAAVEGCFAEVNACMDSELPVPKFVVMHELMHALGFNPGQAEIRVGPSPFWSSVRIDAGVANGLPGGRYTFSVTLA